MVDEAKLFVVYFCYTIFVLFCFWTNKTFADCKEFIKCNTRHNVLQHLPRGIRYMQILIAHSGKTGSTFKCSIAISHLIAQHLANSLRKLRVMGTNPTMGMNFSFCNSRFARISCQIIFVNKHWPQSCLCPFKADSVFQYIYMH